MHKLEDLFQLSATEIFDLVLQNNRCLMNLKGAVAQEHLARLLSQLKTKGVISDFERIDKDGEPDFKLFQRDKTLLMECKNVQKESKGRNKRITVDFWRTRYQKTQGPISRFYHQDEFHILAACLFNRTGDWKFQFIRTAALTRHPKDKKRFWHRVSLAEDTPYSSQWTPDLGKVLATLC